MRVMIVVLVALGVAAVLVLFYGSVRPDGDPEDARKAVDGGLGWLVPRTTLDFDDVANASCAEDDIRGFVVAPGGSCDLPLPDLAEIALCVEGASPVVVSAKGEEYPRQSFEASDLRCTDPPTTIRIYDAGTTLRIDCAGLAACAVFVVAPDD